MTPAAPGLSLIRALLLYAKHCSRFVFFWKGHRYFDDRDPGNHVPGTGHVASLDLQCEVRRNANMHYDLVSIN